MNFRWVMTVNRFLYLTNYYLLVLTLLLQFIHVSLPEFICNVPQFVNRVSDNRFLSSNMVSKHRFFG